MSKALHYAEMRLDISRWTPMTGQFGTSDHVTVSADWFRITDLKYGKEQVDAKGNLQLVEYALGVYDWFREFFSWTPKTKVILRVCQPRLDHYDTEEIDVAELIRLGTAIKERYVIATRPNPPFGPTKKACRWCKVRDRCIPLKEHLQKARTLAYDDFEDEDDPNLMSLDEVAAAWSLRGLAINRLEAMEERLKREMLRGTPIPSLKFVEGRSNRRWRSDAEARAAMSDAGIPVAKQYTKKLITPRTAEGLLTDKQARAELGDAIIKPLGKPTLVSADDPRPSFDLKHVEAYDDFDDADDDEL